MKYETLKKHNPFVIIILVTFIIMSFITIGMGVFLIIRYGNPEYAVAIAGGLFFLFLSFLVYIQSYAWYTGYYVETDHLLLRGVYTKASIFFSEIEKVEMVPEDKAREYLEEPMRAANVSGQAADVKGWYKSNKRYSEMIKFCTVQFGHSSTGGRSALTEQYKGVQGVVSMISLTLKDGRFYLLTPRATEAFLMEVKSRIM